MSKENFQKKRAVLHIYNPEQDAVWGCGAALVSLLTGADPIKLYQLNKGQNPFWPEPYVKRILRSFGFSLKDVKVNKDGSFDQSFFFNTPLVTVQRLSRKETSYQFIYCGLIWHNFEARPFKPLEFLQRPLVSCWKVAHKDW